MKFFGGIFAGKDSCYLNVVLRHAGAFGNKVVRNGKRYGLLLLWRGSLLPLGCEADPKTGASGVSEEPGYCIDDCCAAQREQAPSPQLTACDQLDHTALTLDGDIQQANVTVQLQAIMAP